MHGMVIININDFSFTCTMLNQTGFTALECGKHVNLDYMSANQNSPQILSLL